MTGVEGAIDDLLRAEMARVALLGALDDAVAAHRGTQRGFRRDPPTDGKQDRRK